MQGASSTIPLAHKLHALELELALLIALYQKFKFKTSICACALQFEFARAIREGVKSLLREHLLPRLLTEGAADPGLWTHFAAEAAAFERQLAPARGAVTDASMLEESEDLMPGLAAAEGCLTVIFEVGMQANVCRIVCGVSQS